jgi:hypothetical protein
MIKPGSLFIERNVPRPECFHVADDSHPNAWIVVHYNLTPHELEKELSRFGWTFFYMANVIRRSAFGFDREKSAYAALKRVITSVREEGCNCLQIEAVETHSFLGIPYISVSAHPRHIQKGAVFSGGAEQKGVELTPVDLRAREIVT